MLRSKTFYGKVPQGLLYSPFRPRPLLPSPTKPYALVAAVLASTRSRDVRRQGLQTEALRLGPPRLGRGLSPAA